MWQLTPILIVLALLPARAAYAFDLDGYYGRERVAENALFSSKDGQGVESGGRLMFYPGGQKFLSLGAYYTNVKYTLATSHKIEGVAITGKGDFVGDYYGPRFQITAPIPLATLYVGFSYIYGSYRYNVFKTGMQTGANGDELASYLRTEVHAKTIGLSTDFGFKTRGPIAFFAEAGQNFQTLTMTSIKIAEANYVNGELEGDDSGQGPYEDSFTELLGQTFAFSGQAILGGIEISL